MNFGLWKGMFQLNFQPEHRGEADLLHWDSGNLAPNPSRLGSQRAAFEPHFPGERGGWSSVPQKCLPVLRLHTIFTFFGGNPSERALDGGSGVLPQETLLSAHLAAHLGPATQVKIQAFPSRTVALELPRLSTNLTLQDRLHGCAHCTDEKTESGTK